jgi:WD repeat-containing protein 76
MISAGLDCTVALWDVRTLGAPSGGAVAPIALYNGGRSVNSAYFSPSGRYVVSTTMANKLDLFEDLHLAASVDRKSSPSKKQPKSASAGLLKPYKSITHDNMTGRWLTTFQAVFHPQLDIFAVGSMRQPRGVELFDPAPRNEPSHLLRTVTGDALTAVASRLAFHPRTDQLILVGGNSSGRATIVR